MKKWLSSLVVVGLFASIFLTINNDDYLVKPVAIDEEKWEWLQIAGVDGYVEFAINLEDIQYESIDYKVDYYQKGEYQETLGHMSTPKDFLKSDMTTLAWWQEEWKPLSLINWTIQSNSTRFEQFHSWPESIQGVGRVQCGVIEEFTFGEPVLLAAIVGNEGNGIRDAGILFSEEGTWQEQLDHFDHGYVLTMTIYEEIVE